MYSLEEILARERPRSRGPFQDPNANPFSRIIVADANRLNNTFMDVFRITHVINCAGPSNYRNKRSDDKYVCINAEDSIHVNLFDSWYAEFKEAMDRFLRDPTCINIYVHCQAGMNRSAFLTVAYIVKTFGVPLDRCVEKMVRQRPCVMTNPAFLNQLKDFVKKSE
jgi:protein-tyrosine phosphatase